MTAPGALAGAHRRAFGVDPAGVWAAPGRVNLIGEHTDYNDGWVMPFALPQRARVAVSRPPAGTTGWRFASVDLGQTRAVQPGELRPGLEGWSAYLAGVVWAFAQRGHEIGPLDVTLTSDVPVGAGLSSSAALECAMVAACCELGGVDLPLVQRAQLARRAENDFVGAPTGLMDQAASTLCTPRHAMLFDCRTATPTQVPLDLAAAGLELLVLDTNTPHALVDSEYATRRRSCERAAEILGVPALRDLDHPGDLDRALPRLADDEMRRRVRHVVTENARVLQAADALRGGDFPRLAALLDASHASMRDDFEITVDTVDVAVETARAAGALGARMTGGGFGGCIIALCRAGTGERVGTAVAAEFAARGYAAPQHFLAVPSAGAGRVADA